jgi:uncharacterized protein with ATP-grasp and redox domains
MKIQTECVPCLLKRIVFESEHSTSDKKLREKTLKDALNLLANLYDPNVCSAKIATKVHKITYESLNDKDPYRDLKIQSNKVALSLVSRVNELIDVSDDPIRMSFICSIVGNMMDFGIRGGSEHPDDLEQIFEATISHDLGYDDSDLVKRKLLESKKIVLFSDNAGEIVFDKILCKEIKKFNPNIHLTLVVKGEPVLSDATMEDAIELGFDKTVDEILTTNCFAVGVDFDKISDELIEILQNTDLIICKGMANYESFSETNYKPIVYCLRTKCSAIANSMDVPIDINVVKIYE